jgi:hypothetical protein
LLAKQRPASQAPLDSYWKPNELQIPRPKNSQKRAKKHAKNAYFEPVFHLFVQPKPDVSPQTLRPRAPNLRKPAHSPHSAALRAHKPLFFVGFY